MSRQLQAKRTRKLTFSILFAAWFVVGLRQCRPNLPFRCASIKMFSNGLKRKGPATKRASTPFCGHSVTLRFDGSIPSSGFYEKTTLKARFLDRSVLAWAAGGGLSGSNKTSIKRLWRLIYGRSML